jgi:glycosyltransferase involved in cell wall biosynthesis
VKKRILHIVPSLNREGTAGQVSLLVRHLSAAEYESHVCELGVGGPLAEDLTEAGISVTALGRRFSIDPRALWRLRRHVFRLRPDLIHAWTPPANEYAHAAARICGDVSLVVGHRTIEPGRSWVRSAIDRHVARRAARIVVNSEAVRRHCEANGLPAEKISVIRNGVCAPDSQPRVRGAVLAELGLPESAQLVGVLGPLRRRKRIKDAIWSADLLKVIRNDVYLLILGDGPHRDRLLRYRQQVLIGERARFLGVRSDVPRLLHCLDVLWSLGTHEGLSNAILEAMAAGVPVVAADTAAARDLVVPETTGYLVAVGDRAAVARRTQQLLSDAAMARRLGEAGRARARADFSAERMARQYAGLYQDVLKS